MHKTRPLPGRAFAGRAASLLLGLSATLFATAQYCTPTVNLSGIYLSQIKFDYTTAIAGGQTYLTGSAGYTQTTAATSGTIQRYWGAGIWFNIQNSSASVKTFHLKVFADWNNDGDFNDFMEDNAYRTDYVQANSNLGSGFSITPPLHASGNVRIRFALAEGSTAPTACGNFTGEVEDYILTVAANSAPVLNTAATPFINDLLISQTATEGFTINQLLASASPAALASDANDANQWQMVPRGLAIYGLSASNGTWQYKIGNGAWTAFGAVSATNTLLLLGNGNTWYQSNTRIRFVPTGTGTASFSFRLWDGTSGTNGGFATTTTNGGTTAFSTGTKTASVNVVSSAASTLPVFLSGLQQKVVTTSLSRSTGQAFTPATFIGTGNLYSSYDISLNAGGTKVYWISGVDGDKIACANVDGSQLNTALISGLDGAAGIAVGPDKLFYADWTPGLFSAGLDGTNITPLTGGAGQLSADDMGDIGDVEYANNRIYFVYYSYAKEMYRIMSAKPDGTEPTELYSTARYIKGVSVTATHVYWTELDAEAAPEVWWVQKKLLTGGAMQPLASLSGRSLNDVVADEDQATLYVVTADDLNVAGSELRKVSTNGGSLTTLLSLEGQVTAMALNISANTLPVTLLQYEARLQPDKTGEIRWVTSSEQSVSSFLLQKSTDGRNFSAVATVAAKGTTAGNASYRWIDSKMVTGDNYYRLNEISPDGKIKALGIRRIKLAPSGQLRLYPNPVTGAIVTINTGYAFTGTLTYTLLNAAGSTVAIGTLTQQQQQIGIGRLPKGYYLFSLSDGQQIQFVVN